MMPDEICAYSEFNKLQGQWNSENIPGQGMSSYTRTDLYTALQQENAALVEKIKVLVKAQDENLGTPCENVRLQQENERLREALEPFARYACKLEPGEVHSCPNCEARAALEGER